MPDSTDPNIQVLGTHGYRKYVLNIGGQYFLEVDGVRRHVSETQVSILLGTAGFRWERSEPGAVYIPSPDSYADEDGDHDGDEEDEAWFDEGGDDDNDESRDEGTGWDLPKSRNFDDLFELIIVGEPAPASGIKNLPFSCPECLLVNWFPLPAGASAPYMCYACDKSLPTLNLNLFLRLADGEPGIDP